jgi:8-oxo-dGTP pyrophosphatase MutT (NUDIX family)
VHGERHGDTRPDLPARLRGALAHRTRRLLQPAGARPAAVLVPLFDRGDEFHVLFTRRSDGLSHHGGQVAFPGGLYGPADASPLATAIREAHEEIGLGPDDVEILGVLDDIHTVQTNFVITPFVAVIPYPYAFTPSPAEVAAIFSVPLSVLADPSARREERWRFGPALVSVTTIRYAGHVIWGATERISRNLVEVLTAAAAEGWEA